MEVRLAGTEVYIISGHRSVREKAGELRASGYLVKPIDLDRLLEVVEGAPPRSHGAGAGGFAQAYEHRPDPVAVLGSLPRYSRTRFSREAVALAGWATMRANS